MEIKDIFMNATLKITPINRNEDATLTVIKFHKQTNDLNAFPKHTEEYNQIEGQLNTCILIVQKSLILGLLSVIALCLLKARL